MAYTYMGFNEDLKARIEEVCRSTEEQDETFKYRIMPSRFKKYDYVLCIHSKDKDQAYRRGTWLVKKALAELNLLYWVREK